MFDRIKELRTSKGMTQEDLARKSGVSRGTIVALERGHAQNASLSTLSKIADALGTTVDGIFSKTGKNNTDKEEKKMETKIINEETEGVVRTEDGYKIEKIDFDGNVQIILDETLIVEKDVKVKGVLFAKNSIHARWRIMAGEITVGMGIEAGDGIEAENGIDAGTYINSESYITGSHIYAGWGIEAGTYIKSGKSIVAGEGILAGRGIEAGTYISCGKRIFAGTSVYRDCDDADKTIKCQDLRSGVICYGDLVLTAD